MYSQGIFCLPHQPDFSDIFDICLHWVSVVREFKHWTHTYFILFDLIGWREHFYPNENLWHLWLIFELYCQAAIINNWSWLRDIFFSCMPTKRLLQECLGRFFCNLTQLWQRSFGTTFGSENPTWVSPIQNVRRYPFYHKSDQRFYVLTVKFEIPQVTYFQFLIIFSFCHLPFF